MANVISPERNNRKPRDTWPEVNEGRHSMHGSQVGHANKMQMLKNRKNLPEGGRSAGLSSISAAGFMARHSQPASFIGSSSKLLL